jgi:tetratricopeptide (TPR) repeat protein
MKTALGIVFTFAMALSGLGFNTDEATRLFSEANAAYENNDYTTALALYDSVSNHYNSFELWYNAGNAAFRAGKLGKSILYYERAKRIAPTNDDLLVNLSIANERVADRIAELPGIGVEDLWSALTASSRLPLWTGLALALNLLGFGLLAGWLFARNRSARQSLFFISITLLLSALLAHGMASATVNRIEANTLAIIMTPKIEVKNSPGDTESNAFVLHEGTKVKIIQERGSWYEIRLANGSVGWITQEAVAIV